MVVAFVLLCVFVVFFVRSYDNVNIFGLAAKIMEWFLAGRQSLPANPLGPPPFPRESI